MNQHQHPLEAALEQFAAAVEAEDHPNDMALWATAALASRFGVTFALSIDSDPLTALEEVGQEWAEQIVEMLDDYPEQQADTLRAAWTVVQRLGKDVRRRGLTTSSHFVCVSGGRGPERGQSTAKRRADGDPA